MPFEEDETSAFAKILSKRRGQKIIFLTDITIIIVSLILQAATLILILANVNPDATGLTQLLIQTLFAFLVILIVFSIISFINSSMGLGLFGESKLKILSFLGAFIILLVLIITLFGGKIFKEPSLAEIFSTLLFTTFFLAYISISYYLLAGTKHFGIKGNTIENAKHHREYLQKVRVRELGIDNAVEKGLKWIIQTQTSEGIWGTHYPLFETALVLKMFHELGKPLSYSWVRIEKGSEVKRSVEQTFYILLEAIQAMELELNYEKLFALLAIGLYDPTLIDKNNPVFTEVRPQLIALSEWDLIKKMEEYDPANPLKTIPIEFVLGPIFRLMGDEEVTQNMVDTIGSTINLATRRLVASYSKEKTHEMTIEPIMYGMLLNTLIMLIDNQLLSRIHHQPKKVHLPSQELPVMPEIPTMNVEDVNLPQPSVANVNMHNAINLLKELQEIEGYWKGGVLATAECLKTLIHQESIEDISIKLAVFFLVSMQNKDGSWGQDIQKTTSAVSALGLIPSKMFGM